MLSMPYVLHHLKGIVHGTTLTVLNAFRRKFDSSNGAGRVFITSGLGGMSGAQAKAATICGCVGVIAEIDKSHLIKRQKQGWLDIYTDDVDEIISLIRHYREEKRATSIGIGFIFACRKWCSLKAPLKVCLIIMNEPKKATMEI